jgi:diaminopimelate decarboxylase
MKSGKKQDVIIRINPGVEAHTHAFVQTARTDSKFGFSISDGTALKITEYLLGLKNINMQGFHCHIGSQIFEKQSFVLAANKMMDFIADVKQKLAFEASKLNIGGGFGIYYTDEDPKLKKEDYVSYLTALIDAVKAKAKEHKLNLPYLLIEPGRSTIGEAGITLYTVGAIKDIPAVKKYIAIDGGMFDNPRYALYQSKYTVLAAANVNGKCTQKVTIAGKCCESGDLIAVDVPLPDVKSGDILAVLSTGAYNYSMASNYNRNFIPQAILVKDGKAETIIKKQTYEDLVRNDVIPERLK